MGTEGIRGKNSSLSLTTDSKTHSESVMSPSLLSRLVCKNSESDKMSEGKIRTLDQKIKSTFMQRDVNEVTTTVQSQDELSSGDDIMGLKNTPSRSGRRAVLKAKEKLTLKEEKSIGENFRRTKKIREKKEMLGIRKNQMPIHKMGLKMKTGLNVIGAINGDSFQA